MKKIIIILIMVILIGGGFWWWQKNNTSNNTNIPGNDEPHVATTGIIEGSLSYPSSRIPPTLKVCAESIATQKEYCTNDHISSEKYVYHLGYKLEVPVGEYLVFAQREDLDQKAYYSEFVTCGLKKECHSHKPVPVVVSGGQITPEIDPHDWYVEQN